MLAFADVVEFLPHEFAGLCGGRFAFPLIFPRPLNGTLFLA